METFSALLAFCVGNSPVTGEFLSQRPVTQSFDVFFDLCQNQELSKQWRRQWFETPLHSLWRYSNFIGLGEGARQLQNWLPMGMCKGTVKESRTIMALLCPLILAAVSHPYKWLPVLDTICAAITEWFFSICDIGVCHSMVNFLQNTPNRHL